MCFDVFWIVLDCFGFLLLDMYLTLCMYLFRLFNCSIPFMFLYMFPINAEKYEGKCMECLLLAGT